MTTARATALSRLSPPHTFGGDAGLVGIRGGEGVAAIEVGASAPDGHEHHHGQLPAFLADVLRPAPPVAADGSGPVTTGRADRTGLTPATGSAGVAGTARAAGTTAALGRTGSRRPIWELRYLLHLLLLDALAGLIGGLAAYAARFGPEPAPRSIGYLHLAVALPVLLVAALGATRAYDRRYLFVGPDEYERVIRAGFTLVAAAAIGSYAVNFPLSRGYVLLSLPIAVVSCLVLRYLLRRRLHRSRDRGRYLRRVVLVGHPEAVAQTTRQLRRERYHGLEVVGACVPEVSGGEPLPHAISGVDVPVLGDFGTVVDAVAGAAADTILVLSCPELDGERLRRLAWQVEHDEVDLMVASSLVDVAGGRTTIRPVDGLPMMHVEHPTLSGGRRVVKALFDRTGAAALIIALLPVLLAVALAIRLTSGGPVLFRQVRVGRAGEPFTMIKFRTMCGDAPARLAELRVRNDCDGVLFKVRADPRVTPVGRWLRRFSLDELPQLFNVLAGQMSLVGPRPPLPEEVARYPEDARRRLVVRPGLTGLWQVSGRSDLPWAEAVRLDLRYVENWTLTLDLVILLRTLTAIIRPSGAY
ncbi:MAG TPA: sugar transferase [Micromonosporaceae bacterium]